MAHIMRDVYDEVSLISAPNGEAPNFVDPPSLGPTDIGVSIAVMVITAAFVAVRAITKICIIKKVYLEDYLMAIAVVLFFTYLGLIIWGGSSGGGRHMWDLSVNMAIFQFKAIYIIDIIYVFSICFAKISLLWQIRRIFGVAKRGWVFITTMISIAINIGYALAVFLVAVNVCVPLESFWNVLMEGKCVNWKAVFVSSSAINVVLDILILAIPVTCILRLKLSRRHKLGATAVFATGGFSCAAAIGRLTSNVQLLYTEDVTYVLMSIGLWSTVEVTAAIISGCMPCVPRFVQALRKSEPHTSEVSLAYRNRTNTLPSNGTRSQPRTATSWRRWPSENDTRELDSTKMMDLPATVVAVHTHHKHHDEF